MKSKEEYFYHIDIAMSRFSKFELHIDFSKRQFFKIYVIRLGYRVNCQGTKLERKIDHFSNIKTSSDVDELRSSLGIIGFFRKFICDLTTDASNKMLGFTPSWAKNHAIDFNLLLWEGVVYQIKRVTIVLQITNC